MRRRTFLQLLTLPPLAALWPRAAQVQQKAEPHYTDDLGTSDLAAIFDSNLSTGIEYTP